MKPRCPCCNAKDTEEFCVDGMYCNDCGYTFRITGCPNCGSANVGERDEEFWVCQDCEALIPRRE